MYKVFISLFVMISISSCVVSKPDSDVLIGPDYNSRYSVGNAHFDRKLSVAGGIGVAVTSGAGAYLAYQNKLIQYQDGSQTKDLKYGNAAIGALVGFGTSMIINKAILKQGTKKMPKSPQQWLNKTSNKYAFIEGNSLSFRVMNKSAENNYIVKDYHDFNDFNLAFPNSLNINKIISSSLGNKLSRTELLSLIYKYPDAISMPDLKKEFINRAATIEDLMDASQRFPDSGLDIEKLAMQLVNSYNTAVLFNKYYPSSRYNKQVIVNIISKLDKDEIIELYKIFKSIYMIDKSDLVKLENFTDERKIAYYQSLTYLEKCKSEEELFTKFAKYTWLDFKGQNEVYLIEYFDYLNNKHKNGTEILQRLKKSSAKFNALELKDQVGDVEISNLIKVKLEEEVSKNVSLINSKIIDSGNDEWKKWLENNNYSAGLVKEEGDIKYLFYGEIVNNSKFNLPLRVIVNSSAIIESKIQGTGFFTNLLVDLAGNQRKVQQLGSQEEYYTIPIVKSRDTAVYAILHDFGKGLKKMGVNLMDLFKSTSEVKIISENRTVVYEQDAEMNTDRISKQNGWQEFAYKGLPTSKLYDFLRNKVVSNDEWERQYKEIQDYELNEKSKRNSNSSACYEYLIEDEDWDKKDFSFSGTKYHPISSNLVYKFKCKNEPYNGILVNLIYDTESDFWEWWDSSDYEKGWYFYDSGIFTATREGPFKTLNEAVKEICDCE